MNENRKDFLGCDQNKMFKRLNIEILQRFVIFMNYDYADYYYFYS